MRIATYTRYRKGLADALNLERLVEMLSEFLLDGGFAGGPHFHPYWGWSGLEDTSSVDALKAAVLRALHDSGQLTAEMVEELRGDGPGNPEVRRRIADLLDAAVRKMVDEGYIYLEGDSAGGRREGGAAGAGGAAGPGTEVPSADEARRAAGRIRFDVTRHGLDFLGYRALRNLLGPLGRSSAGGHRTSELATGVEADAGSRPWEFGDTLNLDIPATLSKAIAREGLGIPLALDYEDLTVHQTDYMSSCATVLMLDVSHSMILYGEDRFSPAKQVALALAHLIRTQYPGDSLRVVTFGDRAEEIPLARLGKAQVGPFHTNTAEGFALARKVLRAQRQDMRQIVMITDGKPTAVDRWGKIYRNSTGLDPEILDRTYNQAHACGRAGIAINTFMLARDPALLEFVSRVARITRGKAYFASTLTLGQSVLFDFLRRRSRSSGRTSRRE